jgi:HlyD family secretion protein
MSKFYIVKKDIWNLSEQDRPLLNFRREPEDKDGTVKKTLIALLALTAGLVLASCAQAAPATQQPAIDAPPTVVSESGITVDGKIVPQEFVNLSFNMSGTVAELLVEEGEQIEAGQVIASLDQRERLASAVAGTELEVINARQALDALGENADVSTAAALQKMADARDAVRQAERRLRNLQDGSRQTDIDSARADVVLIKDQLDKAEDNFDPYEGKPDDNLKRATYLSKVADAREQYDNAVRLLNNLEGTPNEIDLAVAEANLLLAEARLALAESDYEEMQAGIDPDLLEAAQARLDAAQSALTASQAALSDAELVAPFTGTVVKLNLKAGEQVVPGSPAVVLADLSQWKVETLDLNEMEIPRVSVGQTVTIVPDAMPELALTGTVESISQIYEEKFGDVTYTARIVLEDTDPRLRWGMTVSTRFEP